MVKVNMPRMIKQYLILSYVVSTMVISLALGLTLGLVLTLLLWLQYIAQTIGYILKNYSMREDWLLRI